MCDYIPLPIHIGLKKKIKDRDGRVLIYTVKDELIEMENKGKAIYLQQLKFADGRKEYRFAYWILGKKGIFAGKWMFGQCASMMTEEVFGKILKKAVAKGLGYVLRRVFCRQIITGQKGGRLSPTSFCMWSSFGPLLAWIVRNLVDFLLLARLLKIAQSCDTSHSQGFRKV